MRYSQYTTMALALMLSFIGPGFGEEAKQTSPAAEVKQTGTQEAEHQHAMGSEKRVVATMDADGVQRIEVAAGEYYFDPNHIVVKLNIPVELKVRKSGGFAPHDMIVKAPEAGIDFAVVLRGAPQTVRFTPTKPGAYPLYCDKKLLWFRSHRERGMEGVIEVVE